MAGKSVAKMAGRVCGDSLAKAAAPNKTNDDDDEDGRRRRCIHYLDLVSKAASIAIDLA